MARRTTTTPKKQVDTPDAAAFQLREPVTPKAPRRARSVARAAEPAEAAETEALFPAAIETAPEAPKDPAAKEPRAKKPAAKARRGRGKGAMDEGPTSAAAEAEPPAANQPDMLAGNAASSPEPEPRTDAPSEAAAEPTPGRPAGPAVASWNAETGAVTFDWPGIEAVAAAEGPNRAMARLLLAARAEGANSRWPFAAG